MLSPTEHPWEPGLTLGEHLERRGVSRRDFLEFCGGVAAVLGVGSAGTPQVAHALQSIKRPSVVWLELQECTGCVESVTRAADPTLGNLILDLISLDYSETLMAAAGHQSEDVLHDIVTKQKGQYVLVVTGSIPLKEDGIYCTIGGRTAKTVLQEAAAGAAAIFAVGACAHWGSVQAARPNPTGAVGVREVIRDKPVINIAGCPPIADVITATIVHFVTFGRPPAVDAEGRPLFAYGGRIHDNCQRRGHFDAGQFVENFDDAGAQKNWCLYKVGCKGPATFSPCPIFQWNDMTSWPIGAGHPCIGCTEPNFWDAMSPFYGRLPDIPGFGIEYTVDRIGMGLAALSAAGIAAHAGASWLYRSRKERELPVLDTPPKPPTGPSATA